MSAARSLNGDTTTNPSTGPSPDTTTNLSPTPLSPHECTPGHSPASNSRRISRPPNAFLIFRSKMIAKHKDIKRERDQRVVSRITGHLWRGLSPEEKEPYYRAARAMKLQYDVEHPGVPKSRDLQRTHTRREDAIMRARKIAESIQRGTSVSCPEYTQDNDGESGPGLVADDPFRRSPYVPQLPTYASSTTAYTTAYTSLAAYAPSSAANVSSSATNVSSFAVPSAFLFTSPSTSYYHPSWSTPSSSTFENVHDYVNVQPLIPSLTADLEQHHELSTGSKTLSASMLAGML